MGKLTRRARAKADYLGFLGAREWPLAASGLGVVLGVVTILPSAVGVVLSVVALALGVATFTRDLRLLRRRWAGFEFTTIAAPFPTAELPPPPAYGELRLAEVVLLAGVGAGDAQRGEFVRADGVEEPRPVHPDRRRPRPGGGQRLAAHADDRAVEQQPAPRPQRQHVRRGGLQRRTPPAPCAS